MPINEMRSITIFAKTAELGSLRKAAESQGMTPQAASQALAQLEQHLGVRLFHRTTRSMALTDEGRQFLEAALPALAGLQHALEVTRRAKDEIAGPLRIVGPRSVFAPVFWPLLNEFCRLHPEVQPDVQLDDRIGNWVEDRVDVGFRIGLSPAEGVIARKLFPLQLIICAAPDYLARHGAPDSLHAGGASLQRLPQPRHRQGAALARARGRWRRGAPGRARALRERRRTGNACGARGTGRGAAHRSGRRRAHPFGPPRSPADATRGRSVHGAYYGSRAAQPVRVRAFIDLAVKRLAGNADYVLSAEELVAAEAEGRAALKAGTLA